MPLCRSKGSRCWQLPGEWGRYGRVHPLFWLVWWCCFLPGNEKNKINNQPPSITKSFLGKVLCNMVWSPVFVFYSARNMLEAGGCVTLFFLAMFLFCSGIKTKQKSTINLCINVIGCFVWWCTQDVDMCSGEAGNMATCHPNTPGNITDVPLQHVTQNMAANMPQNMAMCLAIAMCCPRTWQCGWNMVTHPKCGKAW